ncbi:simple sugar transport system substrate-binding protein [Rhizobium leguminosarum]
MKFGLKSLLAGAAVAGALMCSSAIANAADIRIVAVTHGQANDPFWSVVKNGVNAAAKDMGISVDYRAPETFDMVSMGQLIDAAVNQKPDGLIVSIPDASALGPSIKKAVAAGIPVISINSGSDVSKELGALLHVGQDEYTAGKAAGGKLHELGGKEGLCVNQEVGNVSLDLRCKGFADGFGGKVTVLPVSNDPADVRAKVKAALSSNTGVDTVMALGAGTAGEPSLAAVEDVGMTGKIKVATFDLSADFLKAWPTVRQPSRSISSSSCRAICRSYSWPTMPNTGLSPAVMFHPARTLSPRKRPPKSWTFPPRAFADWKCRKAFSQNLLPLGEGVWLTDRAAEQRQRYPKL